MHFLTMLYQNDALHRNLKMKRWFHNQYFDVFFEIKDFTMYFLFRFHILLKD